MQNDRIKKRESFVYVTYMIKLGAVSLVLGIFFTPLIYLLSDKTATFWFYLILLIVVSWFIGKQNAHWRFSLVKKYLKDYGEIGSHWIENRFEAFVPRKTLKFFYFSLKSFFVFGEWKYILLSIGVYLISIIAPLFLNIIQIKPDFEIIFVILLLYEIMSFHLFFLFLNWKYDVAKKIKKEYDLDYKALISID